MFQKDERVKVKSDLKVGKNYGTVSVNEEMEKYLGKEVTVSKVFYDKFVRIKETVAVWDITMLEKIEDKKDIKKKIYNIPLEIQDIDLILYLLLIYGFKYPDKMGKFFGLAIKISGMMVKLTEGEK